MLCKQNFYTLKNIYPNKKKKVSPFPEMKKKKKKKECMEV